ncbi:unnamed protein product [Ectocarpus sp. 12 AP-2014]
MLLPRCWIHVPLALLLLSCSFGRRARNEAFLINVSSRIIGISSSRPTYATRQPRPPLRLPWGYDRRQPRARPAPQAAGESASVDTDARDLKEKTPLVEIKPAKFHNLRQVGKLDRCRWELLAVSRLLVAEFYGSTIWYPAQCLVELNRLQENFHGYGEDASRHLMLLATSVEDGSLAGFVDIDGREKRPGQSTNGAAKKKWSTAHHAQPPTLAVNVEHVNYFSCVPAIPVSCAGGRYRRSYLKDLCVRQVHGPSSGLRSFGARPVNLALFQVGTFPNREHSRRDKNSTASTFSKWKCPPRLPTAKPRACVFCNIWRPQPCGTHLHVTKGSNRLPPRSVLLMVCVHSRC